MDKDTIKQAALARFASQGYQATTLRELAQDLGVTPAAFYYHYQTKDELLSDLLEDILRGDLAMFRAIRRQAASTDSDPLDLMLFAHIARDETQQMQERVVRNETQFLQSPSREHIRNLIHEYEFEFAEVIGTQYQLSGHDLEFATKAILGMGSSVAEWFRLGGRVRIEQLAELFASYARGVLEVAARQSLAETDGAMTKRLEAALGKPRAMAQG